MKKLLLAGLAMGALALGAPTATADPGHYYRGGCSFATLNDTTPNQALGGQNSWNGEIDILARSTTGPDADPAVPTTDPIYVRCDLWKNGSLFVHGALEASGSAGVAAAAGRIQFTAEATDVVTVCEYVEVNGYPPTYHCTDSETTPIVPEPVQEAIGTVIDALNENVFSQIDPTLCSLLIPLQGQYGPILIDGEGDVYLFGDTYDHLWWDCPDYEIPPA